MSKNLMYPAYLSERAIQSYLKQIPKNDLKSLAVELGVHFNIFSLKSSLSPADKNQALLTQGLAVAAYLERHHPEQIGTLDHPKKYVKGSLKMFSHFLHRRMEKSAFIYFGGSTAQTIVGLSGEASSIITVAQSEIENKNGSRLSSTLPFLIEVLGSDLEVNATRFYLDDPAINLALAFYSMRALNDNGHPAANYTFFARVKLDSEHVKPDLRPSKHTLLASPLFIVNEWKQ